ncbi:succinate dehydrogenase/fumarate reductase iron-sulfur subunit [Fortiea sp. LEGE XX443]|uniref:succinate dehydrogenase/fumarate reductase iron-sulfur subunit n=1 Tax=Fortiea sp. LEGE XX443 TaxID=1828611 RepID=UPI001881B0C7|nr:succinate dehydrogenase/fumarate reductase iron-sulfur subunit [Fortiea sp. LEGE XX443]MBE9007687.1 succinate dehydrogenase/fumarate reductase iron-sulfur subunit [Fortiea sp. LEGE XX443]
MEVIFKVIRQQQNSAPVLQTYHLDVDPGNTILDCLNRIKWEQDGTLAFRKNCRNTICGSCAMRINGRSALACKENVGSEMARLQQIQSWTNTAKSNLEITIAPLGNMPVIKDLVVDMSSFWHNLEAVAPYVSTAARQVPEREFLQTPEERSLLDQTGNCIMCGACYSECNAREVNPDFVGPHALAKAYRMVADSRDSATENRLEDYSEGTKGVWGCTRCLYCDAVCPMEVAPLEQITKIKQEILSHQQKSDTRSIRHRKVLVELVKEGGWIDERQFGLQVVGNYFRDLRGLLSLAPLGLRMLCRGKFPLTFEASEGTQQVRSLIESVQQTKKV